MSKPFFDPSFDPALGAVGNTSDGSPIPQPLSRRRWAAPIHPILCSMFPILALYAQNIGKQPIEQIYRILGLYLCAGLATWIAFIVLLSLPHVLRFGSQRGFRMFMQIFPRLVRKAALAATIGILAFVSYGHVQHLLPKTDQEMLLPIYAVVSVGLLIAILRTQQPLYDTTSVFNFASVVLVAPSCWAISVNIMRAPKINAGVAISPAEVRSPGASQTVSKVHRKHLTAAEAAKLPDIYYIILDAYGRDDRFRLFYGYDNTPFLHELEKRGFYIARHSGSNYDQTELCLSSALSMNYVQHLGRTLDPESLRLLVDDNAVVGYLRKQGYSYVNIWSGLELSRVTTADVVLNNESDLSTFEGQALNMTVAGSFAKEQQERYDHHRNRLLGVFKNLDTVAQLPGPKFVFAHLLAPHPPFVFGANGEAVYPHGALNFADASWLLEQITREQYKSRYIAQLQYVNKRVLEAVDAIRKQSKRPPVIIIQGDHGSRMNLNWDSLEKTDLREPFSILNAYCVPKKVRNALYDTISPINSFRIVFSQLFGADFKPLPDRSFYSTADRPTDFTEVTALIPRAIGPGKYLPEPVNTIRLHAKKLN